MTLQTNKLKLAVLFSFALFFSCSTDDTTEQDPQFSQQDAQRAAEVDKVAEGTFQIMETAYAEGEAGRANSFFPPCATITITQQGDSYELIVDFGAGCTLPNGAFVTGTVLLTYGPLQDNSRIIDYTFSGYTYNSYSVSGGGEIVRLLANTSGNPQSTVNETITVGFPNSTITATRVGYRFSEWVEGVGTATWMDNVFHITGNWNTTFSNGVTRSGTVTETLVKNANCPLFVSGNIDIIQGGTTATIDYGNGTCDNVIILTINGVAYTVIIG